MLGTPKRSRGEDDDYDEADSQRARYDDEGECSEDAGNDSYQPNGSQSEIFMSQMDNPTPAAQRGLYRGQKQVQDRVHGQITLDRLLLLVMDTPDFQRLDNIKQLGGCSYIYPSATHTRKEHSIGVCHLAGLMVKHLRNTQPALGIDDDDELCVKLAGLVHDIGHGPFSHMFEAFVHAAGEAAKKASSSTFSDDDRTALLEVMRAIGDPFVKYSALYAKPDWTSEWDAVRQQHPKFAATSNQELYEQYSIAYKIKYTHEDMSKTLLCHLVDTKHIDLDDHFHGSPGAWREDQLNFVLLLIEGLSDDKEWPTNVGRGEDKRFLLDIVSNKRNGIDVDKLDYLVRDAMSAFGSSKPPAFDIYRTIHSSRVLCRGDTPGQVCFQQKVMLDINEVYALRARLHQYVYQHKIANVAEGMIVDLLRSAGSFQFRGSDGHVSRLEDAVHDPASFITLTDSILETIASSPAAGLERARYLMDRLRSRDFYMPVGGQVKLRTLPQCFGCGQDTEFTWKSCPNCRKSTKKRKRAPDPLPKSLPQGPPKTSASGQSVMASPVKQETDEDYKTEWAAPDSDLTASEAKKEILARCDPELSVKDQEKVFVHIVDITHGRKTTVADPHDKKRSWKTFDPLDNVGFFNPKSCVDEEEPEVMEVPEGGWSTMVSKLFLPATKHVKTLYCYLRMSKKEAGDTLVRAQRERLEQVVEAAIDEWKLERKVGPSIGTHNEGTPSRNASRNSSQQPSQSGTPSQHAGIESRSMPGQGRATGVAAQMATVAEGDEE